MPTNDLPGNTTNPILLNDLVIDWAHILPESVLQSGDGLEIRKVRIWNEVLGSSIFTLLCCLLLVL
jgi:hypothetical protein